MSVIEGKKLKPLTEWCGYADTFHRCVLEKFRVDLSLDELVAGEITIDPKSVEITNLRQKYQQLKFFFHAARKYLIRRVLLACYVISVSYLLKKLR